MLPGVAAENETTSTVVGVPNKLLHLFPTDLAGFVHDDNRSLCHRLSHQEFAHSLNPGESILLQTDNLLSLWRDDVHVMCPSLCNPSPTSLRA